MEGRSPGWYSDPLTDGKYERWWDGRDWLDETKPSGGPPAQGDKGSVGDGHQARWLSALTGSDSVEGATIAEYIGPVTGHAVVATGALRDLGAGVRDTFVGGRAKGYENALREAEQVAVESLRRAASEQDADAVVTFRLTYGEIGSSSIMVTAQGTAVRLEGSTD